MEKPALKEIYCKRNGKYEGWGYTSQKRGANNVLFAGPGEQLPYNGKGAILGGSGGLST